MSKNIKASVDNSVVATFGNGAMQKRILVQEYKDKFYIHFREFFMNDDGDYLPTKKGCAFDIKYLPEIIEALQSIEIESNVTSDEEE